LYFLKNPGKLVAANMAVTKLGEEVVKKAQGEYYNKVERPLYGQRLYQEHEKDDANTQRGKVYLYNLTRFLKTHPLPTDVAPEFTEELANESSAEQSAA